MAARAPILVLLSLVVAACMPTSSDPRDAGHDTPPRDAGPPDPVFGTPPRFATVALPAAHDGATPLPLVVLLHGYGATAAFENAYLQLDRVTRARGVYLLLANGGRNAEGTPFWNATDACCDFDASGSDDVAAIEALLDEVIEALPIDPTRIYLLGHSNGGFMSYRMACERGARFAGAAILAGADFLDPAACVPATPVSILHMHGDMDETIDIGGGSVERLGVPLPPFPSARASVERWAGYAGCDATPVAGPSLDLVTEREGHPRVEETEVLDFENCDPGLDVALWTLRDEGHVPPFRPDALGRVLDWLFEHTR